MARKRLGIPAARQKLTRMTGVPTTCAGRRRKAGRALGCCLPVLAFVVLLTAVLLAAATARAQEHVANYSTGKTGSQSFEELSFWTRDGKRAEIGYIYGKEWKELKLSYAGPEGWKSENAFKVQFPNGHILYIIPRGLTLRVVDAGGSYSKIFRWYYEGPVNGRGTFCEPCAEDEREAIQIVKAYFLK